MDANLQWRTRARTGCVAQGAALCAAALCVLFSSASPVLAQPSVEWLHDRDWFVLASADPKPAAMTFAFPMITDAFEFSQEPGKRRTWEVNVGKEIPIFVVENFTPATTIQGRWGVGLWVSVSFHVLEELGKDPSNPIINTDYRFSLATLKFRRVQRAFGQGPNHADYIDLKADLWHHESTHLGDEFVLGAAQQFGFERINVSYEFWDVGASYERRRLKAAGEDPFSRHMIRGGVVGVWPYAKGYYSDHTLDPESRVIFPSKRNLEPYFQYEYWAPQTRRWALFASSDVRHKTVYDYHKLSADQSEDKQWSTNLLLGLRTPEESPLSVKEFYARIYHGVNPHGQLRNQASFTTYGIGITFNVGQVRR
jgi:hypothetical protein